MDAVREQEMSRADAAILLQGTGYLLKSIQEGRKQEEHDKILPELRELRELYAADQKQGRRNNPWASGMS